MHKLLIDKLKGKFDVCEVAKAQQTNFFKNRALKKKAAQSRFPDGKKIRGKLQLK